MTKLRPKLQTFKLETKPKLPSFQREPLIMEDQLWQTVKGQKEQTFIPTVREKPFLAFLYIPTPLLGSSWFGTLKYLMGASDRNDMGFTPSLWGPLEKECWIVIIYQSP